jgi:putative oxidoreductase
MTTLFPRESTVPRESINGRRSEVGRGRGMALATVRLVVGIAFLLAGFAMLDGAPAMVAMFDALGDALGIGPWIRYLIGAIVVVSAVAVLVPSLAAYGALVLSVTMIGTLATRLFLSGGPVVPPLVLLVGSIAIVWAYRDQLSRRDA